MSEKRKVQETLAAAKFKKLAAKIAADAAGEELDRRRRRGRGSLAVSAPKAPEAALVPRQLSVLEQVAETRTRWPSRSATGTGTGTGTVRRPRRAFAARRRRRS